jgi:ABC-type transport system substrate-binding protein
MLDDAGLRMRGRHRFAATLLVPNAPPLREMAELLRKQWAAIGVDITVERIPTAEWPRRVMGARDFDITLISGGQGPDPDQLRRRYAASAANGAYIGYTDSEFEEAVQRGAREVDIAARARAYSRAQEILARDVPVIPLAESVKVVVHHRRVSGLPQLEARGLVGGFDFSLVKLTPGRPASPR